MANSFLNVCFVAPFAYPLLSGNERIEVIGGAELQQVIVARRLVARGHRISMICLDFGQPDQVDIDGIKVFRAYKPTEGVPILRFVWPRLTRMWGCLKRTDAEIYYQQTASMLTGVMAAFCRKHGRKSVFASASNPDLMRNTPRIQYARDRWIYRYGLRRVDRIFVQNDEQARLCRDNVGREGILVPTCYARPYPELVQDDRKYILWVSTIRTIKRPELFLDLAERLPYLHFRMIGGPGDGEGSLFEEVKLRADRLPNVEFLGFVPYPRSDKQFDNATLFVNTSDSEGFPNTFLQAWSRSIPTVSFVDAGARFNGMPVGLKVATPAEMVATIARLASNSAELLNEGRRCFMYFEANHLPDPVVDIYEQVFHELKDNRSTITKPVKLPDVNDISGEQRR